jgi:hypothetical protein
MANTALVIDIAELFQKTFGRKPYVVPGISNTESNPSQAYKIDTGITKQEQEFTAKGSLIKEQYRGIEILLPIRFYDEAALLMYLPYCVISVSTRKTMIETALSERTGTVKEQFNIEDYVFNIKGFLINEGRAFPEEEIALLNTLYKTLKAVTIENALTNIFLTDPQLTPSEQKRVVIYDFNLPEVQGGRVHVKPFTMMVKSDTVFTLELNNLS